MKDRSKEKARGGDCGGSEVEGGASKREGGGGDGEGGGGSGDGEEVAAVTAGKTKSPQGGLCRQILRKEKSL